MNTELAKLFITRVKTDAEFAKKVSECKDEDEVRALAMKEGFDIDSQHSCTPLLEDALAQVAGGLTDLHKNAGPCGFPRRSGDCTTYRMIKANDHTICKGCLK